MATERDALTRALDALQRSDKQLRHSESEVYPSSALEATNLDAMTACHAALAAPPVEQQAAALMAPEALRNTIGTLLEDAMNVAVKNGANSVSMPDEYVALAVWLCEQPAPQALNATDSERAAMAKTMTAAPAAEPVVWLNPATLETIPHDSKRVFEACPAGSVAALKAGVFTEPLYAAPPPTAQPAPQAAAALVEAVAKAIMFEDCGSTESWAENTNLAEAAIRVCDARNPPRCSHCHSATSAPVHPAPSQPDRAVMQQALDALQTLLSMQSEWHADFPEHVGDKEAPAMQAARAAIAALSASIGKVSEPRDG